MNTPKIDGPNRAVNIVRERTTTGPRIPSADLHARRIAREAEDWLTLARERTRMAETTLVAKALQATAFSVQHRANSFAVPSKLVGTAKHQRALWALVSEPPAPWTKLTATVQAGGGVTVSLGGETLGEVQAKHAWARPLIPFGLAVHMSRVTGHENQGYRLGCNVVFAHVGAAVAGLRAALDAEAGDSGAGAGGRVPPSRIAVPTSASALSGDGAPGSADDLPTPVPTVPIRPGREALRGEPDDIYLWRDAEGCAHASVPHVVRHSATGLEFGYLGSGPADLALSVLTALVDREAASALYQRFR